MGRENINSIKIESPGITNFDYIAETADKNDIVLMQSHLVISKNNRKSVNNYVSGRKLNAVVSETGITGGMYTSPVTGDVSVNYKNLTELNPKNDEGIYQIFNGSDSKIKNFCKDLSESNYTSEIYNKSYNVNLIYFIPYLILMLLSFVLLMITYIEISSEKKKIIISYIHGEQYLKSVVINILSDTLFYSVLSFAGWNFISDYTKICRIYNRLSVCLFIFIILNSAVSLSVLRFSSREIVYGHQYSSKTVRILQGLKISCSLLAFCMIAFVIVNIPEIKGYEIVESILAEDTDMLFVDFPGEDFKGIEDPVKLKNHSHQLQDNIEKMLIETDELTMPVYITDVTGFLNNEYKSVYCNHRADRYIKKMIPEFQEICLSDYECIFLLPDSMNETDQKKATDNFVNLFQTIEGFYPDKTLTVTYRTPHNTFSFTSEHDVKIFASSCFCITENTFASEKFSFKKANHHYLLGNAIYRNTDNTAKIFESYGYNVSYSTVKDTLKEKYEFYHLFILIAKITTVLLGILQISVCSVLVKLDYKINAMELAIKKISGYSIIMKNKNTFINILLAFLLNIIIFIIMVILLRINYLVITAAFLLCVSELIITIFNILSEDKKNLIKTLKGGAL